MSVSSASTVSAMQALGSPSAGDVAVADGYHAAGDGGGGLFAFDSLAISSASLTTNSVTAATNAEPIVPGQAVLISDVEGNTAANGSWIVAASPAPTSTTFALTDSIGNGTYTTGGTVNSVAITASAEHGLVSGQRVVITRNSAAGGLLNTTWYGVGKHSSTVFSIPSSVRPGMAGTFGDGVERSRPRKPMVDGFGLTKPSTRGSTARVATTAPTTARICRR